VRVPLQVPPAIERMGLARLVVLWCVLVALLSILGVVALSWIAPGALVKHFLLIMVATFSVYAAVVALSVGFLIRSWQRRLAQWTESMAQSAQGSASEGHQAHTRFLDTAIGGAVLQLQETSIRNRRLNAINRRINSSMRLEVVLPEVVRSAVELLGATSGALGLCEQEGCYRSVSPYNLPSEIVDMRIPNSIGLVPEVIERSEPVVVENYSEYHRRLPFLDSYAFKAAMGVPLVNEGNTIGALIVLSSDPSRAFGDADVELLTSLADHVAIAITNARLYTENLQRMEELQRAKQELARRSDQLRSLLLRTFKSEDEVRRRIAADVHDGIAQLIIGGLCQIQSVKPILAAGPEDDGGIVGKRLALAERLLRQSVDETYHVIHRLRPPHLDEMGLVAALRKYLSTVQEVSGFQCELEVIGTERTLDQDKQLVIYRIVQEAISNVHRHSAAMDAEVLLQYYADRVEVTIRDNGKGFDTAEVLSPVGDHVGVTCMEERAYSVGGRLEIRSAPGHGTAVILQIPITPASSLVGSQ